MAFFNKKSGAENDVVDQKDLSITPEHEEPMPEDHISEELNLREDFNNEPYTPLDEERAKTVTSESESSQGNGNFGFEEFLNTFAEGNQEEVVLSDNSIKMIKEDIVLEKSKPEFKFAYLVMGIVFSVLIIVSVFVAYIASSFDIVWNYNVAEAEYFFESPIKFSMVRKEEFADTDYIKPGMEVLYTKSDRTLFTKYKRFYVESVGMINITGYDYESREHTTILKENIYYILDEDMDEPPPDAKVSPNNSTNAADTADAAEADK